MASARRMCARDCNVCNFLWQMGGHLLGRWASVRGVILLTTAGSHSVQLPRLSGGWQQIFNICTRDLRLGAKSAPARSRNCKAKYLWFRLPETTNVHKTPPQNSLSNSSRSDASSWARHTCANISRLQLSPMVVILLFTTESISSAGKRNKIDLSPTEKSRRGEGAVWEWLYFVFAAQKPLEFSDTSDHVNSRPPHLRTRQGYPQPPVLESQLAPINESKKKKANCSELSAVNYFLPITVNKNYVKRLLAKTT